MKIFSVTLGCKVNQYESEAMIELFLQNGFLKARDINDADIVLINSCTVTANSDRKLRQTIRRVKSLNPGSILVLAGCMPQAFPEIAKNILAVDVVIGTSNRKKVVSDVLQYINTKERVVDIKPYSSNDSYELITTRGLSDRTRAFLKIEDGCNNFCTYCIIPYVRGRVRSKPLDIIYSEAVELANNGYREIVLVGINLTAYGQDLGLNLCDAIECVCKISKIERVRISSLEPDAIDDEFLERVSKQDKFCPHFHLSLQSGSDKILKEMNRHYNKEEYKRIVENIRNKIPNASITTDILVGFPGESEEDFQESLNFIKEIGFMKVHVFPYSRRPGTKADKFSYHIANPIKEDRSKRMIAFAKEVSTDYLKTQIGKEYEVLFENKSEEGYLEGYTKNYIHIKIKCDSIANSDLKGQVRLVRLTQVIDDYCSADIIND